MMEVSLLSIPQEIIAMILRRSRTSDVARFSMISKLFYALVWPLVTHITISDMHPALFASFVLNHRWPNLISFRVTSLPTEHRIFNRPLESVFYRGKSRTITNLEKISLASILAPCTSLKHIKVDGRLPYSNIVEGLSSMTTLESIELSHVESSEKILDLRSIGNLQLNKLSLNSLHTTQLLGLELFTNLQNLKIVNCHAISNLSVLLSDYDMATRLTSLNVSRTQCGSTLEWISTMTNLVSLNIEDYHYNNHTELSHVAMLTKLTRLLAKNVTKANSQCTCNSLCTLARLKEISLSSPCIATNSEALCKVTISQNASLISEVSKLSTVTDLTLELVSAGSEESQSLQDLSNMTQLTRLLLRISTSVFDIIEISLTKLTNLVELELHGPISASNTGCDGHFLQPVLCTLTNLRTLTLPYYAMITEPNQLSLLNRLNLLRIYSTSGTSAAQLTQINVPVEHLFDNTEAKKWLSILPRYFKKFGSSLAFLNKKSWHISSRDAQQRIWNAEKSQPNTNCTFSNSNPRFDDVDTNVIAISLLDIDKESSLVTGDPLSCNHCPAFLSCKSAINTLENGTKVWKCPLCGSSNENSIEDEEVPQSSIADYVLGPAQASNTLDQVIFFCIDTSGSMSTSYNVTDGYLSDLLVKRRRQQRAQFDREHYNQFSHIQIRQISRLECVIMGVEAQLKNLREQQPSARVSIVTFDAEVTVIGDGSQEPLILAGDKLNDFNRLMDLGRTYASTAHKLKPIKESYDVLLDKLCSLEEKGATSLGPALTTCLGMIQLLECRGNIVVATDGQANNGVGSLEIVDHNSTNKSVDYNNEIQRVSKFYVDLADLMKKTGTSVSILRIKGSSDCKLEILSILAEKTAGSIDIVDPTCLREHFEALLNNKVVATQGTIRLVSSAAVMFRAAIKQDLPKNNNNNLEEETKFTSVDIDIGNITLAKQFSFEFSVDADRVKADNITTLPFQIQICFTMIDGTRRMRVITQTKDVTQNKFDVEKNADVEVLGLNLVHQSAALAQEGKYSYSCQYIQENKSMLDRVILSRDERRDARELDRDRDRIRTVTSVADNIHRALEVEKNRERDNNNEMRGLYRKQKETRGRDRDRSRSRDRDVDRRRSRSRERARSRSRSRSRSPTWQNFRFYSRPDDLSNELYRAKHFAWNNNNGSTNVSAAPKPRQRSRSRSRSRDRIEEEYRKRQQPQRDTDRKRRKTDFKF